MICAWASEASRANSFVRADTDWPVVPEAAAAADAAVEAAQCDYWYDEQNMWRAEFYRALAQ